MDDEIETLLVEVRASTAGFRADVEAMRGALDTSLVSGFANAGQVLERGLLGALRRGTLGFEELKRVALRALDEIAAQALHSGLARLAGPGQGAAGGTGGSGLIGLFTNLAGALLGLPGRATGGPVSPGRAVLVGERGPEVFVPTAAGRIEPAAGARSREVRVAIQLAPQRGVEGPAMLQRSARQIASALARALREE